MPLELRLREIPTPRISTLQLDAAVRTLQRITNRKEGGESKHFKNLKEELKQRLMNSKRAAAFEQTTAVVGRERLLLSLYLEHTGRSDTEWLPPFNDAIAESVLGSDGGKWHSGRRRQAVQLFFTHFDALPALDDLCARLLESFADSESHASSAVNVWHQNPDTIFAIDGPQKVAKAAKKGEALTELMARFALPEEGRFSARLKESFLLTRLESVELGEGQEILEELETIRTLPYQGGVPMGSAALRIMIRRVLKTGGDWKGDWPDWILRLGCDPSLAGRIFGEWWGCWHPTSEELDCARRAVNRQTLEYFIQFLEQSLRGKPGQDQFESRAGFLRWLDDTGKIRRFKLLLHPSAYVALPNAYRQQQQRVAQIEGSGQGTSIIVMECTDDIWIVEGTHIFAIRVFKNDFPEMEVFSQNRRYYSYLSFTQGAMHRDTCSGIWKKHMGDWLPDLLRMISDLLHVEWRFDQSHFTNQRPQLIPPERPVVRGAIHPPSVDSRASQVVIVYLNELRRLLKNGSMTDSFAPREMLLRTLVERGKVKEARVVTNAEDRHFLLLRCVDDMILVDATHYCNIRGTCRNSTLWMSLSDSTPKRCSHMLRQYEFELLVNHSPAEGYVRRFLGGLTANCGVTWTDIAF